MKKTNLALALVLALSVAGCAALQTVQNAYTAITSPKTIYDVKNAYAAGDTLVINYRKYCWSQSYATILADPIAKPICQNRRSVVRTAQSARLQASNAIAKAQTFIAQNPTLDASAVIAAAWNAVLAFKNNIPTVN